MKESIRNWLRENKIYFEIIGLAAAPVASIIVAFLVFSVTRDMANMQKQLAKLQTPPLINISYERGKFAHDFGKISVKNSGGILFNLEAEFQTIAEIVYGDGSDSTCVHYFNLANYEPTILDHNENGLVAEIAFYSEQIFELLKKNLDKAKTSQDNFTGIYLGNFIKLAYDDAVGREHFLYFYVRMHLFPSESDIALRKWLISEGVDGPGWFSTRRISRTVWEKSKRVAENLKSQGLEINVLKKPYRFEAERIIGRISNNDSPVECKKIGAYFSFRDREGLLR